MARVARVPKVARVLWGASGLRGTGSWGLGGLWGASGLRGTGSWGTRGLGWLAWLAWLGWLRWLGWLVA